MIRFENVTKQFADGTEALKGISLVLPTHQLTAIIGPSGCGKTTLMKMINKLEMPTSGNIYIDEKLIIDLEEVELRRSIGYVIQRIGLFPHMTIADNVSLVPRLLGWPAEKTGRRVEELLEMVGLDPAVYKERYPLELSGGQQQRIGVIRALAGDPNIVLMDEPFSALDPISREQLQDELQNLQQRIKKTIVFVTHDMDEALKIADSIIVMRDGQVEQAGTPQQILSEPANDFVRDFIGIERINRQLDLGDRKLKEFMELFESGWDGTVLPAVPETTLDEAARLLEQNPGSRLSVMETDGTIKYAGEQALLKAILSKGAGESA